MASVCLSNNFCVIYGISVYFILHTHVMAKDGEPHCLSRFDHDYKVMQKLFDLEQQQKVLQETITKQQNIIDAMQTDYQGPGSSYVRWGRTACPNTSSSLTYTGFMAGSHKEGGGGANYLCLTDQPLWDHYDIPVESLGKLYGIEYQFWNHKGADGASAFFGSNMYNHDAPCAVCHVSRGATIMVPGRNECFEGWQKEYSGYLISAYPGYKHITEFVCLDRRPEKLLNSGDDDEESMVYMVEGVCDKSLPCPPYIAGKEITCVVCSK